jgi:proline utilization trans-activator
MNNYTPERRIKPEPATRKRALVSCDRCKTRRARCIRPNAGEPCSDCTANGVKCESKLPRKQRVYGSVETLSLRFRALESLVKGLFPDENIQDTDTLFKIAAAKNVSMPATDDFTPAEIFSQPPRKAHTSPAVVEPPQSTNESSPLPAENGRNPFVDKPQLSPQPAEKLIPTLNGVPHYFGPSSSFKLCITVRNLVARCNAIPSARPLLRYPSSSQSITPTSQGSGSVPKGVDLAVHTPVESRSVTPNSHSGHRKRPRTDADLLTDGVLLESEPYEAIADILPSRSVADALVKAYFEHVHLIFPLFNRSLFQFRYEETYKQMHAALQDDEETGWLCCLALVFAFGAQALEKYDPKEAATLQRKYLRFVRSYFRRLVSTTSLVDVQALLLLQLYDHNVGKRNSSWLLIGTAARMVSARSGMMGRC